MRIFERVMEPRRGKEGRRGANRSFHHICDIVFVGLWGKHPFPTTFRCVTENRQMSRGQAGLIRVSQEKKSGLKYSMDVSHNLNVDKVQSNYGGANHRQSDWIKKKKQNIFSRAPGFCFPSRLQLSEHHQPLCLK